METKGKLKHIDKFSNEENRSPEQKQKNTQKRWEHFFSARIAELSKKNKEPNQGIIL